MYIENLIGITTILEDDGLSYVWTSIPESMKTLLEEKKDHIEMFGDLNALIRQGFQDLNYPLLSARFEVIEISNRKNEQIMPQTILFMANQHVPLTFIIISSRVVPLDLIQGISSKMGLALVDFVKIHKKYQKAQAPEGEIRDFIKKNLGLEQFSTYIDYKITMQTPNTVENTFNFSLKPNYLEFKREKVSNFNKINEIENLIKLNYDSKIHLEEAKIGFSNLFFQYLSGLLGCIYEGIKNLGESTNRNYHNLKPFMDFCVFKAGTEGDSLIIFQGLQNVHLLTSNEIMIDSFLFSGLNSNSPSAKNVNFLKNRFNNILLKLQKKAENEVPQLLDSFLKSSFPQLERKQ